jgi:ferredoxin, 2Fe-2S
MPEVVYVLKDGSERKVDVKEGTSVMLGALLNNVPGIEAECGGACSCATCHVYVDESFLAKLPPMQADEDEMLTGTAAERRPNSRLSCQIPMCDELAGLRVAMPERQTM